jgi:hypothetical protein
VKRAFRCRPEQLISSLAFLLPCVGALLVGWSVNHGGICAVAATRDLVERRDARLTIAVGFAAAAAGLVLLPISWLSSGQVHLAGSVPVGESLLFGAGLLGLGAVVNDACLLGSLGRLGSGELRFLGVPIGLALGYALTRIQPVTLHVSPSVLNHPTLFGGFVLSAFALLLLATGGRLIRDRMHIAERRQPLLLAMLVLGVCGTLLYAARPGWGYADAVQRGFGGAPMAMIDGAGGTWLALMTIAGSIGAALMAGRFDRRWPTPLSMARSVAGGVLMAFGAVRVPGGNDSLLLAGVPSGSPSGIVAYLTMTTSVAVLLVTIQQIRLPTRCG